jgi:DNA-binding transcriptional MerR regulator
MKTPSQKLVPIRTVCALYSLNPNTLRTWERRYAIIKPQRSDGGHRGYCETDIANIESMLRLMQEGKSPSEAAGLVRKTGREAIPEARLPAQKRRTEFRSAVRSSNSAECRAACREAVAAMGYRAAVELVFFPELHYWGLQWEISQRCVALEHVATHAIRSLLIERNQEIMHERDLPVVTLACAPEELHDLPVIHATNLVWETKQFKPLLLVSGLPISEVIDLSLKARSEAIVLSATISPRPEVVRAWVSELAAAGFEDRTILVGSGFSRSRVFSESNVRAAPGNYGRLVALLQRMVRERETG